MLAPDAAEQLRAIPKKVSDHVSIHRIGDANKGEFDKLDVTESIGQHGLLSCISRHQYLVSRIQFLMDERDATRGVTQSPRQGRN